ncbi:transcription factor bHLH25 [Triticum aestivum]|uniref:transcription factor bHLH25 n=1 Tax=Triticum aestivum TaxID=4565 RepID=UPI001D02C463|nr:transcription factor bHLH25-like [Triticum aestivum]
MDDSALFMEWAMDTLEQEHPDPVVVVNGDSGDAAFPSLQALREQRLVLEELITGANPANSGSSGETTDGSGGSGNFSSPAAMEHAVWPPSLNSARCAPRLSRNGGGTNLPVTSWNFCAASALPASDGTLDSGSAGPVVSETVYGSQPTRRAAARSPTGTGPVSSVPPYAQDHIMAERKRREKINQRFIELSTVIPGLKKMDKATILSDTTRHVKELQEKIKALEAAAGRSSRSNETVVLVKKPCYAAVADENGSPSSASSGAPAAEKPLPEIEVRFSETGIMVRILCHDVKGVVVRVLSEVEEGLHLTVTHANVMPFTACTVIITITAKASFPSFIPQFGPILIFVIHSKK